MTDVLTAARLTQVVNGIVGRAGENLTVDGYVAHCVYGVAPDGQMAMALEVSEGEPVTLDERSGALLVPSPISAHAELFRSVFADMRAVAAVEISEYWTFPPDDESSVVEFLAGRGVAPSQHPRRLEGVMVSAWWPMGGFAHVETRRIVRTPSGAAYLRPWTGAGRRVQDLLAAGGPGTFVSGWLEECLPAPDDSSSRL